jgi:hypothetical protein
MKILVLGLNILSVFPTLSEREALKTLLKTQHISLNTEKATDGQVGHKGNIDLIKPKDSLNQQSKGGCRLVWFRTLAFQANDPGFKSRRPHHINHARLIFSSPQHDFPSSSQANQHGATWLLGKVSLLSQAVSDCKTNQTKKPNSPTTKLGMGTHLQHPRLKKEITACQNCAVQYLPTLTPTHPNIDSMLSVWHNRSSHTQKTTIKKPKPKNQTKPKPQV